MSSRLVLGNLFAWIELSFFALSFSLLPCLLAAQNMSHCLVWEQRNRKSFLHKLCVSYWGNIFVPGSAIPTSFKYSPKDELQEDKMENNWVSFFPNVVRISQHFEKWNPQFPPSLFCSSQLCLIFLNHHISQWRLSDGERGLGADLGGKAPSRKGMSFPRASCSLDTTVRSVSSTQGSRVYLCWSRSQMIVSWNDPDVRSCVPTWGHTVLEASAIARAGLWGFLLWP